jgi:hexosaminidase
MRKISIASLLLFFVLSVTAQEVNIIPKPHSVILNKGEFVLTGNIPIFYDQESDEVDSIATSVKFLDGYLKKYFSIWSKSDTKFKLPPSQKITLGIAEINPNISGAYKLEVTDKIISIRGSNAQGIFNGIQTLIQLLPTPNPKLKTPNLQIPQLTITDYPRFQYRGMHLDCSRHFWSVDFVKQYIDYLALHKFNKFHWHLTDDQGWRIEIKKYPTLTSIGGWRNGTIIGRYPGTGNDGLKYGGFYTQEQIKEIVKYAAERYIDVIPEIEMPGHASAAIAAYPELSCFPNEPTIKYFPKQCKWNGDTTGKQVQQTWGVFDDVFCAGQESTFKVLEDVMEEVLALFPSKYIHVGGDECPKENWKRCPNCQQRMKDNNLKDEHGLQSYFIQRMEKYLNNKGRILIGWDEILEGGLAPKAVVMSWRGEKGGIEAAQQNHDVIMTPGNPVYFDHTQSENEDSVTIGGYNPIEKVYAYEPIPAALNEEQGKHVLGAQANMWTEYMKNTKKVAYMLFPRIAALSEVLWSKKENKNWDNFQKRLQVQFKRYDLWKAKYSKAYFDLRSFVSSNESSEGVNWNYSSKIENITYRIAYKKRADSKDTIPVYSLNDPSKITKYKIINPGDTIEVNSEIVPNRGFYSIRHSGIYTIYAHRQVTRDHHLVAESKPLTFITQKFIFNKATGKKISLKTEPSKSYPGDGAFTLVNGVHNNQGLSKAKQFLGFDGTDCEAIVDLVKTETINTVTIHALWDTGAWIWKPQSMEAFVLNENGNWQSIGVTDEFTGTGNGTMTIKFPPTRTQQVKIKITNWGEIQPGNSGAGSNAWLFVDEIEVE